MPSFVQFLERSGVYAEQGFMIEGENFNLVCLRDSKDVQLSYDPNRLQVDDVRLEHVERIACLRNLNAIVKFLRGTLATSILMPMLPRVALSSGIPMPLTLTLRPRARPSGRALANSAFRRRSS